jgi:hypothetical protein
MLKHCGKPKQDTEEHISEDKLEAIASVPVQEKME